jgi:molybdenum cofactor biosynthesis enzyme MoaA
MLSGIEGIKDLSMTTNGILLAEYAEDLKKMVLTFVLFE